MISPTRAIQHGRSRSEQHFGSARAALAIAGSLLALLGSMIAISGMLTPSGSVFYFLAGFGLILSGTLVARRRRAGAWIFLAVFAVTLIWSLRDLGSVGAPLAERLVGPSVLLGMIALLMPLLRGWPLRKTAIVFTALMTLTIGLGVSSTVEGPIGRSTSAVAHLLDTSKNGVL